VITEAEQKQRESNTLHVGVERVQLYSTVVEYAW